MPATIIIPFESKNPAAIVFRLNISDMILVNKGSNGKKAKEAWPNVLPVVRTGGA
jgi:hypothetical protein